MDLVALMRDAFSNCTVTNKYIRFAQSFSEEELIAIQRTFTQELYDFMIPHHRVVGIYYKWSNHGARSVLTSSDLYNDPLLGIEQAAKSIVPDGIYGNDDSAGCFLMQGDEFTEACSKLCVMLNGNKSRSGIDYFTEPHEKFGCLLARPDYPDEALRNALLDQLSPADRPYGLKVLTTRTLTNMHYLEVDKPFVVVPTLVDEYITRFEYDSIEKQEQARIAFITMKGIGTYDYCDNRELFNQNSIGHIMPVRTVHDLTSFLVVANNPVDGALKLFYGDYNGSLDEKVLTKILNDYGKEYCEVEERVKKYERKSKTNK